MHSPLLVEYYSALPEDALRGGLDWPISQVLPEKDTPKATETRKTGKARRRAAIHIFCKQVREKYTQGTLLRILQIGDATMRRAAIFALGMLGTSEVNESLARFLHDENDEVAQQAAEALWRCGSAVTTPGIAMSFTVYPALPDSEQALAALDDLCTRAKQFPEAFNQRAILHFQSDQFLLSARDCTTTLRLNPHHFGAQAGLGQCLLRLRKPRAALRAFRFALRINPRLEGLAEMIKALEARLKDDNR